MPWIIRKGVDWFRSMGSEKSPGPKLFSVSGDVVNPGNFEFPLGVPAREVILGAAGGCATARPSRPGPPEGTSTPMLTADHLDTPMDFEGITAAGSLLGTAAVMVFSEDVCMVRACLNFTEFYAHESCGKCTPCREGTDWMRKILGRSRRARAGPTTWTPQGHLRRDLRALLLRPRRRGDRPGRLRPEVLPRRVRRARQRRRLPLPGGTRDRRCPLGADDAMSDRPTTVKVTIDGQELEVRPGTLVIRAAEQLGTIVPRFCDHRLLAPWGRCRQCLVEVVGQRKPLTACTTTVTDGMEVKTQVTSEVARAGQEGNLELLLINHPLDCPMCDKGGECPLQDQTLAHGPGETRFVETKRHYEKPIKISETVLLDRERCVLCARCTRFSSEIAGDPFIELFERGALEQVAIYEDEPYQSNYAATSSRSARWGR